MYESANDPAAVPPSFVDDARLDPWREAAKLLNKEMRVSLMAGFIPHDSEQWLCALLDSRGREVLVEPYDTAFTFLSTEMRQKMLDAQVAAYVRGNAHLVRCAQSHRTAAILTAMEEKIHAVQLTLETLRRISGMAFTPEIDLLVRSLTDVETLRLTYCQEVPFQFMDGVNWEEIAIEMPLQ